MTRGEFERLLGDIFEHLLSKSSTKVGEMMSLIPTLLLPSSIALNNGLELSPAMGYSSWNDCASEVRAS